MPRKHTVDLDNQGSMLIPAVYDREAVLAPEEQFWPLDPDSVATPEITDTSLIDRNGNLVKAIGLLAQAGKMGGLHRSRYLPSSDPAHSHIAESYGVDTPWVRERAAPKQRRLIAQAKIHYAGAAGYITLKEMNDHLKPYVKSKVRDGKKELPPEEAPLPEDVKERVDPEFRKFQKLYGVPVRGSTSKESHKHNKEMHAKRRNSYKRVLRKMVRSIN